MSIAEKLTTIAENEIKVYETGKQAKRKEFWDTYQTNGTRKSYRTAFAGEGWKNEIFDPIYDIEPTNAYGMFWYSKISGDFAQLIEDLGITFNTSKSSNNQYLFGLCDLITRVGVISFEETSTAPGAFQGCTSLETIEGLIFKEDGTTTFQNTFANNNNLRNINEIKGIIGTKIEFQQSTKLSRDSILGKEATAEQIAEGKNIVSLSNGKFYGGIFGALSDTATGQTLTLSKTAVNNAFYDEADGVEGSKGRLWTELIATKPNWTISLI